jgi:hypothetical protein
VRDDAEWRLVVDFDGDRESLGQKCFGMSLDAEMDFERLIPDGVVVLVAIRPVRFRS